MYVKINDMVMPVDTVSQVNAALHFMAEVGVSDTQVFDSEDNEPLAGVVLDLDIDPKAIALASVLDVSPLECEPAHGDTWQCTDESGEYLVLTSDEREEHWDAVLEYHIDECILPEIPESYRSYFDAEAWKRDARFDGAGHALSSYDGEEHAAKLGNEWFYIYRVN